MFSLTLTNLECRLSLIQKLGLESEYLESCLVRSEELLRDGEYQAPLRLMRKFGEEDDYQSVLDFLTAIFVPGLRQRIFAFYKGDGQRLIVQSGWSEIDRLDRMMVTALRELRVLYDEIHSAAWRRGEREVTVPELTAAWLDLNVRPRFAVPTVVEATAVSEAA
jgi:hypothetical protein